MKKLTDLIIERNHIAPTAINLLEVTGCDVYGIAKELASYPMVWARGVMKNPTNNKPFEDAITALANEAIRENPDMAKTIDLSQLPKAASCLRLATIEAVLKSIEAGQIPTDDETLTAPVLTPVVTPTPPKKKSVVAMPTEWTGTK